MSSQAATLSEATKPICGFVYVDGSGRNRKCRNVPLTNNGPCKVHNNSALKPFSPATPIVNIKNRPEIARISKNSSGSSIGPSRYQNLTVHQTEKSKVCFSKLKQQISNNFPKKNAVKLWISLVFCCG